MKAKLRPIAIYLPQFHPITENNEWWGKGFTEWTNVAQARPLFEGHYQPHIPADLGFYDLRLDETRAEQAALATEYGIHGFCYYHYWFNGRRILERPFQEVFESGKPDFPFMLCWANENWTRIWDGGEKNILLEQKYSDDDDREHIRSLIPYFKDPRYIRIDNKPVIAIYRTKLLPDPKRTTDIWRQEASKHNMDLYICRFESGEMIGEKYVTESGFDAGIDFQPFGANITEFLKQKEEAQNKEKLAKVGYVLKREFLKLTNKKKYDRFMQLKWLVRDYEAYVNFSIKQPMPHYKWFPGITPMWDNTSRRKNGALIFKNSSPMAYFKWLKHIVDNYKPKSKEENLLFINAWNEWAEGNHLEPCQKWGLQYLQKTKQALGL
jgi:lipopolysaccharide biosynthesis protein